MQDNDIRFQMSLLDGYPASCKASIEGEPFGDGEGGTLHPAYLIPDYINDLNAVAKVAENLKPLQVYRYKQGLKRMRGGYYFKAIDATARQRCEAILRAVGKWEA